MIAVPCMIFTAAQLNFFRPQQALHAHMHLSHEVQACAVQAKCKERNFIIVSITIAAQLSIILVCGSAHNDPNPIGGVVCR